MPRAAWQLLDDGGRLRAQSVHEQAAHGHRDQQDDGRADWPRDVQLRQPVDWWIERVADEDAEHDRNDHALRVLQQRDAGDNRNHRQREVANVNRRFHFDRRRVGLRRRRGLDFTRWIGDQLHCTSSSACSALLMATAALTPSAAATTTNWASRDASPATKTRGTLVSQS